MDGVTKNLWIEIVFEKHRDEYVAYIQASHLLPDSTLVRDADHGWIPNSECQANAMLYDNPEDAYQDIVDWLAAWKDEGDGNREEQRLRELRKSAKRKVEAVLNDEEIEALGISVMDL